MMQRHMARLRFTFIALLPLLLPTMAGAAEEPSILNPSGLPVPRFVSLKSDYVNVRVGPGKRYPIRWVYTRQNMPVEIVEEFAHWRKIRDMDGDGGWVHKSLLSSLRTAMIVDKAQNLYAKPDPTSRPTVRAGATVISPIRRCAADWCELQLKEHRGWVRKVDIWGVKREEVFEN